MKLSAYAKEVGVTYKTAYQWWRAGQLDAYQLPTGAIIVRETKPSAIGVALYARVSSADQQEDVARQMQRLRDDAAARGYQVVSEVTEIASGLNDERPKLRSCSLTKGWASSWWSIGTGSHALAMAISPLSLGTRDDGSRRSFPVKPATIWWTISWRSSRVWRHASTGGATPSAERRRCRHVSNAVSSRRKYCEYHPASV
jgi:Resolvase, N terminal domain